VGFAVVPPLWRWCAFDWVGVEFNSTLRSSIPSITTGPELEQTIGGMTWPTPHWRPMMAARRLAPHQHSRLVPRCEQRLTMGGAKFHLELRRHALYIRRLNHREDRYVSIFCARFVFILGTTLAAPSFADGRKHWVATATFFAYTAPVAPVYPPGAPTAFAPATIQPDLFFPFPDAATTAPPPTTRPSARSSSPISGATRCASASPTPSAVNR